MKLVVTTPSALRAYLIANGFAWAASSYSKNYYDVRVGVEDTNALANEFTKIAAARGRTLAAPTKTYLVGHSMGGHITAAAIETETATYAKNKVNYDGAIAFLKFMTDPATQEEIGKFGVEKFGQQLFIPDATKTDADLGL